MGDPQFLASKFEKLDSGIGASFTTTEPIIQVNGNTATVVVTQKVGLDSSNNLNGSAIASVTQV